MKTTATRANRALRSRKKRKGRVSLVHGAARLEEGVAFVSCDITQR